MFTRFIQLIVLTLAVAFVHYTTASPLESRAVSKCSGNVSGMTDVKDAFTQDAQFCNFWLAGKRKNSPISNIQPSAISSACKCIIETATASSTTILAPTPKPAACAKTQDPYYAAMLSDLAQPEAFCKFWFMDPARTRTVVPGVGAKKLSSICSCITTSPKASSTTSPSTTTSTFSTQISATPTSTTPAATPAATSSSSTASATAAGDASSTSSSSSSTTTSTSSTDSASPTPKSDAAICPALSGDTLVDSSGTAYAMQCGKVYSGTLITGGNQKRDAAYTIENCLTACNGVTDCVAVTVLDGACYMMSDVSGYSTTSGGVAALNEVRAEAAGISEDAIPSLDGPASSSSTATATASDSSEPTDDSNTSTSADDSSPTTSSTASAGGDSDSSDSTPSSTSATETASPSSGTPGDGSSDSTTSSSSTTASDDSQTTESSAPESGDDSSTTTETQSAPASTAPVETQSTPADPGSSETTATSASAPVASVPPSDKVLGCSAPSVSVIDNLPAVACGADFDQTLNNILGYYTDAAADIASVEAAIIPGLASSGLQRRTLSATIQSVAKDAISTILEAAQSITDYIVAALPGDVQTAEAAVPEVSSSVASPQAAQALERRGHDSVHKPGTQWNFARRAANERDLPALGTALSTGSPSSSSSTTTSAKSTSGTAPVSTTTSFRNFPTGTAPTQAVHETSIMASVGTISPLPMNQTTSAIIGTGTAAFPTSFAANHTSALSSLSSVLGTAPAQTSSSNQTVPLSTGATSGPTTTLTSTSTSASSSIPLPSSNATSPITNEISSVAITITDTTKSLLLQPRSDGSLFVSTKDADVSSLVSSKFVWDKTNDVVFGDTSSRLLHYFPSELNAVGASRFRLAGWGDIPVGASLLNLVPFKTDATTDPVLVAVDSVGNYLWPFACSLQGQTNKVFLVSDLDNGASVLESSDLLYTVVGGVANDCAPLALTGNGMTGINA